MTTALLQTKLYIPPARPDLVPRPRLIHRLDEGLRPGYRLTLVSAPAGYGKTTLLSEWIHTVGAHRPALVAPGPLVQGQRVQDQCDAPSNAPTCVAWLSLDEGDNDPIQFLTYLVGALQTVDDRIGQSVIDLLQSPQPLPAAPASPGQADWIQKPTEVLINDIIAAEILLTLVLDDYHLISSPPVHQVVRFLLERQPPSMHLVISTREAPPLPLARLRARGQVTEIRERDLRFTAQEAAAFLSRTMGLHLSPEAASALRARTEGWVAGLQLAALSLQQRQDVDAFIAAFAGSDRHVTDYLVEEVLHRQPEEIQTFLLHTAILDRLSTPLCDTLLSDVPSSASSQAILERLDAANLFIVPLDNRREWYRYHHLFADLLRRQLQREYPERLPDLHHRASHWHEQVGDVEAAIHHAFAIPDIPLTVHLMEQHGSRFLDSGQIMTLLDWLQQIPDEVLRASPRLCTGYGWALALTGQVERAERYVEAGEAALSAFEPLYISSMDRIVTPQEIRGDLMTIRAYCARLRGDPVSVLAYSQQALEYVPADEYGTRAALALNMGMLHQEQWDLDAARRAFSEAFEMAIRSEENAYVAVTALAQQGDVLATQGNLAEAAECYQQAIELGLQERDATAPIPGICLGHLGLAEIHLQRQDVVTATHHLEQALELTHQVGNLEMMIAIGMLRPRLLLASGDLAQTEALLDQADQLAREFEVDYHAADRTATRGALHLARGDVDAAAQLVADRGLQPAELAAGGRVDITLWDRLPEYLLLARVLLAQDQVDAALAVLTDLVLAAETCGYALVLIEATILQALAHYRRRELDRAVQRLERALALAGPQGYVRPFLRVGKPIDALLRQAIARDIQRTYAQQILAVFLGQARERGAPPVPDPTIEPLYEQLTERELQVLRLLGTGLSSTQVAEELFISVSTARSYIKVIYRKLDVHSRGEAIARGRQLGLL